MSDDESRAIYQRYRDGDSTAGKELFDRYLARLIALVRSRLSTAMNRRIEAEWIAGEALASLIMGARSDRYIIEESGALWRLLASIAINKLLEQERINRAGKRTPLIEESGLMSSSEFGIPMQAIAGDPTPAVASQLSEQLELAMSKLKEVPRSIVELHLQGYSDEEIMEKVGRTRRSLQRALEEFRTILEGLLQSLSAA